MSRTFTLVLPAFNEEASIPRAIEQCSELASTFGPEHFEAIFIDDGSTDGSWSLLEKASEQYPWIRAIKHPKNAGYGAALRSGFEFAQNEIVAYTDADNQFRFIDFVEHFDGMEDVDMIAGYRANRLDPPFRLFVSSMYNRLARILFRIPVRDVNCSFKLMHRTSLQQLPVSCSDFFIDTEIVARAQKAGWRIVEVPARHYAREEGLSTVRASDVPRTIFRAMRMWFTLQAESVERFIHQPGEDEGELVDRLPGGGTVQ